MNNKPANDKILIITASLQLQDELLKMLPNHKLVFVKDAENAIEILKVNKQFSMILVGIYLKETDGFKLLNYLKEDKNFYTGPVLVIVDSITDDVINDTKEYDIFDFVVRYSNEWIIKARIRNALIYYSEKRKLLEYAIDQMHENLSDMKMLIAVLAQVLEFKNEESGKHVENVGIITNILIKKLIEKCNDRYNIDKRDIEYISMAAALHDIGKIYIPDEILNKPGKLDKQQRIIMETHAALGASIVEDLGYYKNRPIFKYIKEICLGHHERWDGKGYPNKLSGNDIPISAQIVSLADCYDALTSDRVYRKALSHEEALEMILSGKCGAFNPDLIECLKECEVIIKNKNVLRPITELSEDMLSGMLKEICKIK